ncbi:unnamed protein product [Diatraea saccharalis]|uniref:Uncharacterized protein n=1 Tax=Diatraea saccharalis TaxID=40085 RepID=A0A9N9N3J8_9NEOP|nr:unnamed protein product [Diatraea saccharalis]
MLSTFNHRMKSFESQLQKTSPTTDTDALAADFVAFKQFICTTLRTMQYQIEWVAREVDRIEMRGRQKILLLHGVGEMPGSGRPRPILFKVRDVNMRDEIWAAKTGLEGSEVTLSEFLTKARHSVFMEARQRLGVSKCWTREWQVFVLGPSGTRHRVECSEDLGEIVSKQSKPTPLAVVTKEPVISRARRGATSKK